MEAARTERHEVAIVGGGIAALEAVLYLRAITDGSADVVVISPDPEFVYRPLIVREPFSPETAERRDLRALLASIGADLIVGRVESVESDDHLIQLEGDQQVAYGQALIAAGSQLQSPYSSAETLWTGEPPTSFDQILRRVPDDGRLNLIVPPGATWSLPIYEFALMGARRLDEVRPDVRLTIVTPEQAPLIIFGTAASGEIADLLELRSIGFRPDTWVIENERGELREGADGATIEGVSLALPVMAGRPIGGLPVDRGGFIPIDEFCRVRGLEDVFAAGDGTSFPIKQGGIATQQADTAAAGIASALGFAADAQPFHPVLRGKLLTGGESLHMHTDAAGGDGEGVVSSDYLWWPPHKVSGRYLAPWLARESLTHELEPPARTIDVEVSMPHEWHSEPMSRSQPAAGSS
jgi:sulfide:quinone oxidoreductase